MEGLILICSYWKHDMESVDVYYDEFHETITIINYDSEKVKFLKDLKNMHGDMINFIASDFDGFEYVDKKNFMIFQGEASWIKTTYMDGHKMLKELSDDYGIVPEDC